MVQKTQVATNAWRNFVADFRDSVAQFPSCGLHAVVDGKIEVTVRLDVSVLPAAKQIGELNGRAFRIQSVRKRFNQEICQRNIGIKVVLR